MHEKPPVATVITTETEIHTQHASGDNHTSQSTLEPPTRHILHHTCIDLSGVWSRNASRGVGVQDYIAAHGQDSLSALAKSQQLYIQCWQKQDIGWHVTTMKGDEIAPYRRLLYPFGHWQEKYDGPSTLFGTKLADRTSSDPDTDSIPTVRTHYSPHSQALSRPRPRSQVVQRFTAWQPQFGAVGGLAHVTTSHTALGIEISSRFLLDESTMVLRRSFRPLLGSTNSDSTEISADEIFERQSY